MKLIVKTFHGLEEVLAQELRELGAENVTVLNRAVSCDGDKRLMYRCNLELRTGIKVLKPIHTFTAKNEQELYNNIADVDWSEYITLSQTFAIDSVVSSEVFRHSKYVALKSKDAIVDQFSKKTGRRPFVNATDPDISINIQVSDKRFTVSLDSSGDSLHKRGYRNSMHDAPINEVLAAGLIALSGWDKKTPLIDPMCGSGTIPIEAAMRAANIPTGIIRKKYGFMNWKNYDKDLWTDVFDTAKSKIDKAGFDISAFDVSARAISMSRGALADIRLTDFVKLKRKAFEKNKAPEGKKGIIIMNPPYGERLQKEDIYGFYHGIGSNLKRNFEGYDAWIISSNDDALESLGLRPFKSYTLYNGALECKFQKYTILKNSLE